jgi:hypothetical protein
MAAMAEGHTVFSKEVQWRKPVLSAKLIQTFFEQAAHFFTNALVRIRDKLCDFSYSAIPI